VLIEEERPVDLHPQLRELLTELEAAGYPDQTTVSPEEARRITDDRAARHYGPQEPVDHVLERPFVGPDGLVKLRIYWPKGVARAARPLPIMIYYHGGGWVLGSLKSHDRGVRALTNAARCVSVSVDYRLAPENPFPAAVEDCAAALRWVAENAAAFDGDPSRIAVAGDSAGGNLAAVTALRARDEGGPKLAFQLLIYPVVDSDLERPSYIEHADAPMLQGRRMAFFWDSYVPDAAQRTDWRAAPFRASDLSGLPPTMIVASGIDPLVDEGKAYAERLEQAGVPVDYRLFPRMTHAFFQAPSRLDDSRAASDAAGAALRKAFGND